MGKANTNTRRSGAELERVVFYNSIPLFKKGTIKIHHRAEENSTSMNKVCWWNPSENAFPVEFCQNTSMHGLPFIGRPNLHIAERIFWTVAFILGLLAAVFLINDVWQRYYQNPVIVAFQAHELDIDTIPFPAVTICSMNAFPKSKVKSLQKTAQKSGSTEAREAREALKYVREICHSQRSFAKEFQYAYSRGEEDFGLGRNDTISEDTQNEMMKFLMEHTIPCENLIRLCMFAEQPVKCESIFKPLITDYGKCCTFNILPLPLLLNRPVTTSTSMGNDEISTEPERNTVQRAFPGWSDQELELWRGMPYGLSILVDPNLNDWYCPVSDSEGVRFVLHNPLEMPFVDEFASLMPLNKEIMKSRNCYFPEDHQLRFFGPYTSGNCVADCTARAFHKKCNCTYFYMPRGFKMGICNTDPHSVDYKCMSNAKIELLDTLKTQCKHCESLCESIEYNFETTTATLQDSLKLWNDPDPEHIEKAPSWANNKMSIIHIFIGSETVVPKLRKLLYGTTDLIASTGGLLGLCLGFSVLSAMEVIYFLTLRAFWRICWKSMVKENGDRWNKQNLSPPSRERIIQLNPNQIPLFYYPVQHAWKNILTKPTHITCLTF